MCFFLEYLWYNIYVDVYALGIYATLYILSEGGKGDIYSPNRMRISKKISIAAIAMVAAMTATGICAYFTDTDAAVNEFTVGEVKIDLQEPEWDNTPDDEKEDRVPGDEIPKDPQVENVGKNSAYIFVKVAAPKDTFIRAEADGTRVDKEGTLQEVFYVNTTGGEFGYVADSYNKKDWTLLSDYTDTTSSKTHNYYVFAYNTAVAKGAKTTTLFDNVKVVNAVEGFIDNNKYDIDLNAYAIQSENIPENVAKTMSEIYQVYLNQNPVQAAAAENDTNVENKTPEPESAPVAPVKPADA